VCTTVKMMVGLFNQQKWSMYTSTRHLL
jgi:hypothetical protein